MTSAMVGALLKSLPGFSADSAELRKYISSLGLDVWAGVVGVPLEGRAGDMFSLGKLPEIELIFSVAYERLALLQVLPADIRLWIFTDVTT